MPLASTWPGMSRMPNPEMAPAVTLTPKSFRKPDRFSLSAIGFHLAGKLGDFYWLDLHCDQCRCIIIEIQDGARRIALLTNPSVEIVADFELHKKKEGPLLAPTSYQAMTSEMTANDSG